MATSQTTLVRAEVMLRDPQSTILERVANYLRDRGLQVTALGAASISIRCGRLLFEKLFKTHLTERPQRQARPGILEYGRQRLPSFKEEKPIEIPTEIAADVSGIYLQRPATFL